MKYRNKLFLSLLCSAVSFSVAAQDKSGFYLGGKLGMSVQQQSGGALKYSFYDAGMNETSYETLIGNKNTNKTVFSGGIAGGYDFNSQFNIPVRVELEYVFRANGKKTASDLTTESEIHRTENKVRTQTVMLNGYWDIQTGTQFIPYVTAGLGVAHNKKQVSYNGLDSDGDEYPSGNVSKSKAHFAWSLGTGIAYEIDQNWTVDLGYRFLNAGKVSVQHVSEYLGDIEIHKSSTKVKYHDIHLGFRYAF